MRISTTTARRLALSGQGLDGRWRLPRGKEGAAQAIERLGYVQIDTIAVVQRAHHHTIWSRRPDYGPEMLHELQATDRRVFEYWTHAASYLPMRDYRYFARRMRAFAGAPKTRDWLAANADLVDHVLGRIRSEGALGSADFAAPEGQKRGPWWDWKPAKRALEMLFSAGAVMVSERRNFQRMYDLTERVLPPDCDTTEPGEVEAAHFAVRRDVAAHGVASAAEVGRGIAGPRAVSQALAEMTESGDVTPVVIEGLEDETHYALARTVEKAASRRRSPARLHLLSPFDSLVIWRRRLAKLFGFDYKLECYLPASQRRHGYFCLPVLWGDRFIGRLDPKADRQTETLFVRSAAFERGFAEYDEMLPLLASRLRAFARFNGCRRVVVEETSPRKVRAAVRRCLREAGAA